MAATKTSKPPAASPTGAAPQTVALICGDDDFAVKQRARALFQQWSEELGGMDHETIDARVNTVDEALKALAKLREALNTLPFFGGAKVVWFKDCSFLGEDRTAGSSTVTETLAEIAGELKSFDWRGVRLLISSGKVDKRRFVLTAGNLSISDMFGTSDISGDGRTQFLNWSSIDHGHFDYAADARGFSWGAVGELYWDDWTVRGGRFIQPRVSNGLRLDYRIFKHFGDQLEVERRHVFGGQPGVVKAFAFRNVASMASFRDALNAAAPGTAPGLELSRRRQSKVGWGISFEQSLTSDLRVLARGGAHDGKTESFAFTEIDQSIFLAASLKGSRWGRAHDNLGVSFARNGLSNEHRNFLAAGGSGFFLGDGRLNYAPEQILEAYYSWVPAKGASVSFDWQRITNPGYNRDRGPVNIGSVRLHYEF